MHPGQCHSISRGPQWAKNVDFGLPDECPLYHESGGKADIAGLRVRASNRREQVQQTAGGDPPDIARALPKEHMSGSRDQLRGA
jgi:hypothetical protein